MNLEPFAINSSSYSINSEVSQRINQIFMKINTSEIGKNNPNTSRGSFSKVINNNEYNTLSGSRHLRKSIPNGNQSYPNGSQYVGNSVVVQYNQMPPPPQAHYSHIPEQQRF